MSQPAAVPRRKRGTETVADMARSLGLVLALIVVALLLSPARALIFPSAQNRAVPPDYRSVLQQAGLMVGHPVPQPSTLPSGWTPNAARVGGTAGTMTAHVGFVTPAGQYVALDEAQGPLAAAVAAVLGEPATVTGTAPVAGWQRWVGRDGRQVLARLDRGVATMVSGTSAPDVARLAASVR